MTTGPDPPDSNPPRGMIDRIVRRLWPTMDESRVGRAAKAVGRPVLRVGRVARGWILAVADRYGLVTPDHIYSEGYYLVRNTTENRRTAARISDILDDEFAPDDVIDLGCATGTYLQPFLEAGCVVRGVDGHSKAIQNAVIPAEHLELHDLRTPYEPTQRYDLAICFEVLEHIPQRFADTVVRSIAAAGDIAVVSAAPPGQGSVADHHHVNEQPADYWIEKFEAQGMRYALDRTQTIKGRLDAAGIDWPVADNVLVFTTAS